MEMKTKLAQISEIMGDGYHFFNMMNLVEHLEERTLQPAGDHDAQQILDIISQFHRLCLVAKRGPK